MTTYLRVIACLLSAAACTSGCAAERHLRGASAENAGTTHDRRAETLAEEQAVPQKDVGALRVQLMVPKQRFQPDEPLTLTIELQNASNRPLVLAAPTVLPIISAPFDHPYASDHGCNTVVAAEEMSSRTFIRWAERALSRMGRERVILRPNEKIVLTVGPPANQLMTARTAAPANGILTEVHRAAGADFAYAGLPGTYRLTATYAANEPDAWQGTIISEPVEVTILRHEGG